MEKLDEPYRLLSELRSLATIQSGYVSGETLVSMDNPNKVVVVSTWLSRKRWDAWFGSEDGLLGEDRRVFGSAGNLRSLPGRYHRPGMGSYGIVVVLKTRLSPDPVRMPAPTSIRR